MLNASKPFLSIVIPVFNEVESVAPLMDELRAVLSLVDRPYEIIFVDDGSSDGTLSAIEKFRDVYIISFARNHGKSKALEVGLSSSKGDIVVTLDGDLQDDPGEIPNFVREVESGSDLVVGWKKNRKDPFEKRFFSKIANGAARLLAGSSVHDMNCGFKAFRGEVARSIRLYGDMHRYIPAVVIHMGYKVTEIPINHRSRKFGKSKYGISRLAAGFFDLVTLLFMRRFLDRPMHFFGFFGAGISFVGIVLLIYLSYLRLFLNAMIGNRPLLFLSILLVVVGFQSLSLGLLGELVIRQGGYRIPVPIKFTRSPLSK